MNYFAQDVLNQYVYRTNLIEPAQCKAILAKLDNVKFDKHEWVDRYDKPVASHASDLYMYLADEELRKEILPFITKALGQYLKYHQLKDLSINRITNIRFNKYIEGTEMKQHIDNIPVTSNGEYSGVPILSVVGNLNQDYEGAELIINEQEIPMTTGDLVVFPSTFLYPHGVSKATKGTRYSFAAWGY